MNVDEKKIDQIQAEVDRLETVLTSLTEKIDKLPTKSEVGKIKTELKEKQDSLNVLRTKNLVQSNKFKSFFAATGSNEPPQLRKINFRNSGNKAFTLGDVGTFVARWCMYFSFYDNPFKDDLTSTERDELIKNITGKNARQPDNANSANNNLGISD